jgi:hypothetical protein
MNIRNGAFAPMNKPGPGLQKSIDYAEFIPLNKMTPEHWKVLDWDFLSNTAKNNIVAMALESGISGFVHYKFISKGSPRGGYFDPRPLGFDPNSEPDMPRFKNYGDDPPLSKPARIFDDAVGRVAPGFGPKYLAPIFCLMSGIDKARGEGVDSGREGKYDESQGSKCVSYIQAIMENDWTDYSDLDIVLTWVFSVLHEHDIEWLEEWAQEAEQILGEAEDKNLL